MKIRLPNRKRETVTPPNQSADKPSRKTLAPQTPVKPGRETKTRRRELRLTPSADDFLQVAMAISGLTAGDLAYEGARRLLEDHERGAKVQGRSFLR